MPKIDVIIDKWIKHISVSNKELGGFPVCPFAKNASYEIIETNGSDIIPPSTEFDITIYKLPDNFEFAELLSIAKEYNSLYPDLVFLPDGKNRFSNLNGIQTNNGEFNLLLCQNREDLEDARNRLFITDYYTYWDKDYLDEILKL